MKRRVVDSVMHPAVMRAPCRLVHARPRASRAREASLPCRRDWTLQPDPILV
ncbi:hypothetical protein RMHFA_04216 [Roseomonas mucosa]|nr:hypothetical protein RMHFA_04216 [Roseomonas mucosa]